MQAFGQKFNSPLAHRTDPSIPDPEGAGVAHLDRQLSDVGDVDGDGLDDLIAVNDDSVWVMLSNGSGFDAPQEWISQLPRTPAVRHGAGADPRESDDTSVTESVYELAIPMLRPR